VAHVFDSLPENENPNFVDMCCGSGVFLIETLKQTIERYEITPETCSDEQIAILMQCVVGFDIDPLAVLLAKMNWAMSMRVYIPYISSEIIIPIYHADSLFASAPLTKILDANYEEASLIMRFDDHDVSFPGCLISPQNRRLFDLYIQTCYEIAKARAASSPNDYTQSAAAALVTRLCNDSGTTLDSEQSDSLIESCLSLIPTLENLQREGRNGIWPFLLSNSYRPGLVRGQFNAI